MALGIGLGIFVGFVLSFLAFLIWSSLIDLFYAAWSSLIDLLYAAMTNRKMDKFYNSKPFENKDLYTGNINTCVCCGAIIPEGRQVCPKCEKINDDINDKPN